MKELLISQDEHGEWTITSKKIPGFVVKGKNLQEAVEKIKQAFPIYYPCRSDNCEDLK